MRQPLPMFLCFLFSVYGCIQRNEIVEPVVNPSGFYSAQVHPIFERNCGTSSCHGGGPRGFAAGLDLTSHEGIMRGSKFGAVIIPGSVFMSHLVQSINWTDTTLSPISSVTMPASRNQLPERDIQTIVRWVGEGARDDNGQMPFPEPRPAGKVFFTSQAVDLVGVIDVHTGLVMRYVGVGRILPFDQPPQAPHNVQIDDQGRYYYVTLISANKLRKYDAATNQFLGEATVGTNPAHVVISADGSTAYVTNFDASIGRVYKVQTSTMSVSNIISQPNLMGRTHGARLSHDGRYLYIGNNATDLITVLRTSNDSIVAHIPVAAGVPPFGSFVYKPYQIAVRGDDRFLYVTLNGRGLVSIIERIPGSSGDEDSFEVRDTVRVGERPLQCEVTPDQRFLYVCNQASGSISVINAQTNRMHTTITNVGRQPHGIDISADSRLVYVTLENVQSPEPPHHPLRGSKDPAFIAIIDVATNQVIRRIEVGAFAAGISVYPGKGN